LDSFPGRQKARPEPNWPDLKDHKGRLLWLNNYSIPKELKGAIKNLIGAHVVKAADIHTVD
jgi:hypothetical protein